MTGLQRFLRKMKRLDAYCDKTCSNEKSHRTLILGMSAAACACLIFTDLPFNGQDAACTKDAASGNPEMAFFDTDILQEIGLLGVLAAEGKLSIKDIEDDLKIFGEYDYEELTLKREVQTKEDILDKTLISVDAAGNPQAVLTSKEIDEENREKKEKNEENKENKTNEAKTGDKDKTNEKEKDKENKTEDKQTKEEKGTETKQANAPAGLSFRYNEAYCINLSAEQREVLETIVEAEAGDEDIYGKILVANVVLNRVLDDEFPDTVKEVVFQNNGKTYQFSPVRKGGRYYTVTVSEHTKAAVARALEGEDYSSGALYFFARRYTSKAKATWFDTELKKIAEYGCHEFFGNK